MKENKKTCFVIMPISDQDGYDKDHFTRVYNHLIKPACNMAGFDVIRADDEAKTNYIVIDIVRKIINSDMVICDLSGKNPNVLYELGLRQAFNKKVVLIKDLKTTRIFDIQGLRTLEYDESLRIDDVEKNIKLISNTLSETEKASSEEVNSLIQLLAIQPAMLPQQIELSQESSMIMDVLNNINNRLIGIEEKNSKSRIPTPPLPTKKLKFDNYSFNMGEAIHNEDGFLGYLIDVTGDSIILKKDGEIFKLDKTDARYQTILPF